MREIFAKNKVFIAILFQLLIVFSLWGYKSLVANYGQLVRLQILPIDPRHPILGDYITFNYEISSVDGDYIYPPNQDIKVGDSVYVSLYKSGKVWRVNNLSKIKPENGIFIKGSVSRVDELSNGPGIYRDDVPAKINLVYGIEQFFIPENSGKNFSFFDKDVVAEVSVDQEGRSVIKQIFVDGNPW